MGVDFLLSFLVVVKKKTSKETADKINANKKPKLSLKQKKSGNLLFSHPWVASSLKAHGAAVLDMDFSQNGKYLITVAEGKLKSLIFETTFSLESNEIIVVKLKLISCQLCTKLVWRSHFQWDKRDLYIMGKKICSKLKARDRWSEISTCAKLRYN